MDLQLKDKVVLITGGAKGIGEAITRGCAREGAIPVFVDQDAEAGKRLQMDLVVAGATCSMISADVLSVESCRGAVEQTLKEYGRLNVLVNNVGANDNVGLENGTPDKFVSSLRLNLFHYYNMAHFALPALKKSQGCILNIASKVAVTGQCGCGLLAPMSAPRFSKICTCFTQGASPNSWYCCVHTSTTRFTSSCFMRGMVRSWRGEKHTTRQIPLSTLATIKPSWSVS